MDGNRTCCFLQGLWNGASLAKSRSLKNLSTKDIVHAEMFGSDCEYQGNKGCCTSPEGRLTYHLGEQWDLSLCAVHVKVIVQASQGIWVDTHRECRDPYGTLWESLGELCLACTCGHVCGGGELISMD